MDIKLSRLVVTEDGRDVVELNIYGVSDDLCVVGDATLDFRLVRLRN